MSTSARTPTGDDAYSRKLAVSAPSERKSRAAGEATLEPAKRNVAVSTAPARKSRAAGEATLESAKGTWRSQRLRFGKLLVINLFASSRPKERGGLSAVWAQEPCSRRSDARAGHTDAGVATTPRSRS
jgi:hypothetical protein